jgi:hypothetical protein
MTRLAYHQAAIPDRRQNGSFPPPLTFSIHPGNFRHLGCVTVSKRGCHEGLFHKSTGQNLGTARCAGSGRRLPHPKGRGTRSDSRSSAGSRKNCAASDLIRRTLGQAHRSTPVPCPLDPRISPRTARMVRDQLISCHPKKQPPAHHQRTTTA